MVYAGSFDPPTNGHLWMMVEGAKMADRFVVAIGINPDKKSMFSIDERMKMLKEIMKGCKNVEITCFENCYLVDYAKKIGADYILRGIRSSKDYEYEASMRHVNEAIGGSGVQTVFLMPPYEIADISSSLVKSLVGPEGWEKQVRQYVPKQVYDEFLKRANETKR